MAGRKKRSDSITAAVDGFSGAIDSVPMPQGVELRSDEERVIWGQFTRARAREDWRENDLLLLAKVVRMEADIRKHQEDVDAQGWIVENQRGTKIPNPLVSIIDTIERRQMSAIRSLGLNQMASDPRTVNGKAKQNTQSRNTIDALSGSGLIAMPRQ